jgi:hypothetical protein
MRAGRLALAIIICLAASALCPARARAQAWVPAEGEGSVTTIYQNVYVRNHIRGDGTANTALGRIRTNSVNTSFEYGITDRLALDAELAWIASRYDGHHPHGPEDTGRYHPQFQDAYVGVRYNVAASPVVVTPFVGALFPTHGYETRGHAAVGRGFRELHVGVNAGRSLAPVVKDAYVEARYTYAMTKRFEGLNLNRSYFDWEAGWAPRRSLSFRFLGALFVTHGGLVTPLDAHIDHHLRDFHDRATRGRIVRLGGAATYSVGRAFDIHGAYATTVYGRNTHAPGGFALGFSWRFSRGLELPDLSAAEPAPSPTPAGGKN